MPRAGSRPTRRAGAPAAEPTRHHAGPGDPSGPAPVRRPPLALDDPFDDVLAAARAGAGWAWTLLYEDLAPVLRGYLAGRGAAEPDDLVGEVFLRVVRSLSSFDGDERAFRSWVFTIAHHRLIDEHRRRDRRPVAPTDDEELAGSLPPSPDTTEAHTVERLTTEEITRLLDVLTDDQREVLLLRVVGGLTIPEIADVVGRTENATKALQRRGLRALQRHLEHHPYPFDDTERSPG